ncbi:MAG: DUF1810 domain-containing protein [Bacteroidaceae bacterium]|nr:DUF1810 domain-containing protein [Bacteroidaceae bacterium]
MEDKYNLNRFLQAQEGKYAEALQEIKNGQKVSHWIWYIYPQLEGFGRSHRSKFYAISGADEAQAYLAHPTLGARLREITEALAAHAEGESAKSIRYILGDIDAMKVKSCMTLFEAISNEEIFGKVLRTMYGNERDIHTLEKLK